MLVWFMAFSPFPPRSLGAHGAKLARRAAPKARAAFSGGGPELVSGEEAGKSRGPQSAGRSYSAEAVPERTGRKRITWTRRAARSCRNVQRRARDGNMWLQRGRMTP